MSIGLSTSQDSGVKMIKVHLPLGHPILYKKKGKFMGFNMPYANKIKIGGLYMYFMGLLIYGPTG